MAKLPEHFFVSSGDGSLHDTRLPLWWTRYLVESSPCLMLLKMH